MVFRFARPQKVMTSLLNAFVHIPQHCMAHLVPLASTLCVVTWNDYWVYLNNEWLLLETFKSKHPPDPSQTSALFGHTPFRSHSCLAFPLTVSILGQLDRPDPHWNVLSSFTPSSSFLWPRDAFMLLEMLQFSMPVKVSLFCVNGPAQVIWCILEVIESTAQAYLLRSASSSLKSWEGGDSHPTLTVNCEEEEREYGMWKWCHISESRKLCC